MYLVRSSTYRDRSGHGQKKALKKSTLPRKKSTFLAKKSTISQAKSPLEQKKST